MKALTLMTGATALVLGATAVWCFDADGSTSFSGDQASAPNEFLASNIIGSKLYLEDGHVQIRDLHLGPDGDLAALIVEHPSLLRRPVIVPANLVYLMQIDGAARFHTNLPIDEFELVYGGGGSHSLWLEAVSSVDTLRRFSELEGEPVFIGDERSGAVVADLVIEVGGQTSAFVFEEPALLPWNEGGSGRLGANLVSLDYTPSQDWRVSSNVTEGQLDALAGRETALFLAES